MIKNKKILVTGGAGTVGCNIVKKLVDRNAEVTVVDNLSAYPFDYLKDYGVGDISTVNFVKGDITDKTLMDDLIQKQDIVIHAAAMKHVPICEYNPDEAKRFVFILFYSDMVNVSINDIRLFF